MTIYKQGSGKIFKYLCDLLDINISLLGNKQKKQSLFEVLKQLVCLISPI